MSRRVLYSVAASLDGYIAGPGGEYDWIPDEPAVDWDAFMARFDTVLMGRGTWEVTAGQEAGRPGAGLRTFVFSRTLDPGAHPDVTVVAEDAGATVEALRGESGRDIWLVGGGVLFRSLLDRGLVDGVEVAVVPLLLGRGIPLLPPGAPGPRLSLTGIQRYPSGIVLMEYAVT